MAQDTSPAVGFGGDVPADLKCGFCQRPIQGAFYRTMNRFTCAGCVAQVRGIMERNTITPEIFARAAGAGLLAGVVCAAAWAAIVQVTQLEIGIIASLIGVAVAKAIYFASGKRRAKSLQWLAVGLSVAGMVGGKLALDCWQIADKLKDRGVEVTPALLVHILKVVVSDPASMFRTFDLVWIAIAVFAAWRLCKAPVIKIAGPYPFSPPGDGGLQFHTIEPASPAPSARAPAPEQP